MIIIGSEALKYWYPSKFNRVPKDIDIIVDKDEKIVLTGTYSRVEKLTNPVLLKWHKPYNKYLSPDYLYTLKLSHNVGWDLDNGSWNRHTWDIQFLKEQGCKINWELFYELYEYWETLHGKNKRSNLEMSSEDFFDNAVKFPVKHDDVHELLIQHEYFEGQEKPTYSKILEGEVDVCMEKFKKLSEKDKFNLVFEEVAVMAEERFPQKMHYKAKFGRMLKKFIISHAKLEEAVWILENHKWLMTRIPFNYSVWIQEQIKNQLAET